MEKWFALGVAVGLLGFTACSGGTTKEKSGKVQGEGGTELKLTVPESISVTTGKSADFTISVERKGFDDNVTIKFEDEPKGTSIDGGNSQKIDKGSKEKKFTLKAEAKADEVKDHTMKVTGTFNDGKENHSVSKDIKVTVKK